VERGEGKVEEVVGVERGRGLLSLGRGFRCNNIEI
jgi:hypothetical protein